MNQNNILIAGIPRSGTSLACYLLNKCENIVALNEPIDLREESCINDKDLFVNAISDFIGKQRIEILNGNAVTSMQLGGRFHSDNYDSFKLGNKRKFLTKIGKVDLNNKIKNDFLLIVKFTIPFIAAIEKLSTVFPIYSIVRNPLSVLSSWNTIQGPSAEGRPAVAEKLDKSLSMACELITGLHDRQLYLLSYYYQKIIDNVPFRNIIRYEDIIATNGKQLTLISTEAQSLNEELENKNLNRLYDKKLMITLGKRLLETDGTYWNYYSKESIELMVEYLENSI
jgi:hypothetical protein